MEKLFYWQAVRTIFISLVVVLFIIPVNTSGSTKISNEEVNSVENNLYFNGTEGVSRRKRNTLFPPTGNGNTNLEGLLASCQLTNLLLYQVLQQRSNPILGGAGGGLLQSGSSGIGFLNNILAPGGTPPLLTTYVTTSTVSKKMTSTDVITIPLLFGNKPSPTTITRTKTYQVTSEELVTLTSTIKPTPTSTVAIVPSATPQPFTPILDDPRILQNVKDYSAPLNSIENQTEPPVIPSKARQKKRKYRQHGREGGKLADLDLTGNPSTERYSQSDELSSPAYAPFGYYKQPDYYQEPIVNYQETIDTRRLKRRGESEEVVGPRELLLEPSYDNDASNDFPSLNQCPQITITKTITKFVNPPASVASYPSRGSTRYDRSQQQNQKERIPVQAEELRHQPRTPVQADEPRQQQRRRDRDDVRARLVQRQPEATPQQFDPAPQRFDPAPQRFDPAPQRFDPARQRFEAAPQRLFEGTPQRFEPTTGTERNQERRVLRRNGRPRSRTNET